MKKAGIFLALVLLTTTLFGQYLTPWGISPLAVPPNAQTAETRISSLSLGGLFSTEEDTALINYGLQQTGLNVYISIWDTLDIEELGEFSVYDSSLITYFLKSDSLGPEARFNIQPDVRNMGTYTWDETHRFFTFRPELQIVEFCDTVVFTAFTDTDTLSTIIHFTYLPKLPTEEHAMGLKKVSSGDNILMNDVVTVTDTTDSSLHIAGRILLFDKDDNKEICQYSAQVDDDLRYKTIKQIFIYADSLVIHEPLWFPGCDVTIYARKLVFDNDSGHINTSPFENKILNTGGALSDSGENAGNIYLYTGDIQMGPGIHLILNGGNGQPTNPDSVPSVSGGDGGQLQTPVFISSSNYSLKPGVPGGNPADSLWGDKGSYVKTAWDPTLWVHARVIQPVMNYLRLQYMENNLNFVSARCAELNSLLADKFADADSAVTTDDADLMNAHNEIRELQNRLERQMDYYGNPIGWVPLLSFEVYKGVFENEVDNAFNLMFLSYLINKSDAKMEQVEEGMDNAREAMRDEVGILQVNLNENIGNLETYENIYELLRIKSDSLQSDLGKLEKRLLKEAEENAEKAQKRALFKSIASIGGSILSVIPHPACQAVGTGLTTVSELNLEEPFSLENATLLVEASANAYGSYKSYKEEAKEKMGDDTKIAELTKITEEEMNDLDSGLGKWNAMNEAAGGLVSYASDFDASTSLMKVSDEDVQAELDKLRASSSEYKNLMNKIETNISEKRELHEKIEYTMNSISRDLNRIAENRMGIQALTQSILDVSGKRDIRTVQYTNSIEKRAFERLQKYHYMMTRAYEYRTLMPWTQPLDMESIRNRMVTYVEELSPDSLVLPQEQFEAIKGIYLDQLHEIADTILANFEQGGFTKNRSTSFTLSKEELEMLNQGEEFYINPYERNLFGLDKENIRILKIGVVKCMLEDSTEVVGNLDDSGLKTGILKDDDPFEIVMEHQGYSKLQSEGKIYYFNHNKIDSRKFEWRSAIDITGDIIRQERISNSDQSLLHSLIDGLSDSQLTFTSEPSAWADISMNRISGSETRKIISMVLEINFDYKVLHTKFNTLKVETDGYVSPYYLLSEIDENGFKDGKGNFYRTYNEATRVLVTAQEQYGNQRFQRWDQVSLSGVGGRTTLTHSTTADITTTGHTHLIAVYESLDSVWIKTPLTNQTFSTGEDLSITWDQNIDHDMKIDLYSEGFHVTSISDSIMGKSFVWEVPQNFSLPATSKGIFKVKITSRLDNTIFDWSDNILFIMETSLPAVPFSEGPRMLIYPNPADNVIWIGLEGLEREQEVTWTIYSTEGKAINKGKLFFESAKDRKALYLDDLYKGAFILNIDAGHQTYSRKFLIE